MNRKFHLGDTVYSFVGERLVHFEITDYHDPIRVIGKKGNETFCVCEDWCYLSRTEAFMGMMKYLRDIVEENLFSSDECKHQWRARLAKLPVAGFDIPIEPVRTDVYCHLCGRKQ